MKNTILLKSLVAMGAVFALVACGEGNGSKGGENKDLFLTSIPYFDGVFKHPFFSLNQIWV